ncbi:hypothetical protein PZ897_02010 [Hoeflea sp. YIM 152468]|uniref:hypothetical protein n=1 Tax=Hoeflea sp. YIM 152468 TaxID=3031759 RepID=UPI0023D9FA83|nr:hypothetical protein [Hoeflea sp. YIM 152468]MDF1606945.1 hypothetical protein [Hoeflea sp. YIM 152468]
MTAYTTEKTGVISLTAGSKTVTGDMTLFSVRACAGGILIVDGVIGVIASVESDTAATLEQDWAGSTVSEVAYIIVRSTASAARLVNAQDKLADLVDKLESQFFFDYDAFGTALADRDAFDDEAEGFKFALLPASGTGGPVLYVRSSATPGTWTGGVEIRGPAGPAGVDGVDGVDGVNGVDGADGVDGVDGAAGAPGSSDVVGTSATSLAIGSGSKTFTVTEADRGWGVGARLRASSDADGSRWMEGVVTAYSGVTLEMSVDLVGGAGTRGDWTINLAGERGTPGADGDGFGDMVVATYDPQAIAKDVFDRANHTGSQAIGTVTGLQSALDERLGKSGGTVTGDLNVEGAFTRPAAAGYLIKPIGENTGLYREDNGSLSLFRGGTRVATASGAHFGIGTASPEAQLHTTEDVRFEGVAGAGGAGVLKVDAEGNVASGGVNTVQVVRDIYTAYVARTEIIPLDDTIPKSSEGFQVLSATITPTKSTNKLRIKAILNGNTPPASSASITASVFNGGVNAIVADTVWGAAGEPRQLIIEHEYVAGTTSAVTISIRMGRSSAGDIYFNGTAAGRTFGGVRAMVLTVEEIDT